MIEISGKNWNGYLSGQAPVQGCGVVDGFPWYFRARWSAWSMEIANDKSIDCECLPVVGDWVSGWTREESWGEKNEASYMDESIATKFIEETIQLFRDNRLEFTS